jgi:hypothetical protein
LIPILSFRDLKLRILFLAAAIIGFSGLSTNAQFLHPKVNSKQTTVRTVVVMPAKVTVVRDSMKGPEGMAAESDELSTRVEKMISEVLSKQKNITSLAPPAAGTGSGDSQPNYSIADFQTKFDELLPKIMKKRSDVKKGRFSMGDEVLNLNLEKSTDAIVFIRGEGKKLTGGKTAFNYLVYGTPAYLTLRIGIVDARNGEVLLYTDPTFKGDPTTAIDRLRKALENGLKKMPTVTAN